VIAGASASESQAALLDIINRSGTGFAVPEKMAAGFAPAALLYTVAF